MAKSKNTKLEEQRERQAVYRLEQKLARRPERDDFARVALWWLIKAAEERSKKIGSRKPMNKIVDILIGELVHQGFDEGESEDFLDDLSRKYLSGWSFQRKPHLQRERADQA